MSNVDNILVEEYRKQLENELELQIHYVTTSVVDDYAERVGQIKATRAALNGFNGLVKKFFPF